MNRWILLVMVVVLSSIGCGGSGGNNPSVGVTSPSISLVGTYILIGYDRNGIPQAGYTGRMELGDTEIYANFTYVPIPWVNGTYQYALRSSLQGDYIQVKQGNVEIYAVFFSTDNTMILTMWRRENNVMHETRWEKTSDSTALN